MTFDFCKLTLLGLVLGLLGGCNPDGWQPLWSQAKPETRVSFDPLSHTFTLHNSKDVTIKIAKAHGRKGDAEFDVEGLEVIDNASAVRLANVQQLDQVERITARMMEPINKLADSLAAILPMVTRAKPPTVAERAMGAIGDNVVGAIHAASQPVQP